jgi:hypothetical protein
MITQLFACHWEYTDGTRHIHRTGVDRAGVWDESIDLWLIRRDLRFSISSLLLVGQARRRDDRTSYNTSRLSRWRVTRKDSI